MAASLDVEKFSTSLDWKQFEGLAEHALRSFGFKTTRNFRLKKPAQEIDLIAVSGNVAFGIDCKHWKRSAGKASMNAIAEKQIKRCKRLFETESIERVIPVILTWHDEQLQVLENGVAIVPIQKISDFFLNWESSNNIQIIRRKSL